MKRFGLIGNPISHSLSPSLFEAGYPDSGMTYDLIQAEKSEEALSIFKEDYDAINITAPFKEDAYRFAQCADEFASAVEAANILVKEDDTVKAYNSDCLAVMAIISKLVGQGLLNSTSDRILVVGCGGAGKAAAYAAAKSGFTTDIVNRSFDRAVLFCDKAGIGNPHHFEELSSIAASAKMIIYTIPEAITGFSSSMMQSSIVLEANYRNPSLAESCNDGGIKYISGKEWLIEQALSGFRIMTGKEPDEFKLRARTK